MTYTITTGRHTRSSASRRPRIPSISRRSRTHLVALRCLLSRLRWVSRTSYLRWFSLLLLVAQQALAFHVAGATPLSSRSLSATAVVPSTSLQETKSYRTPCVASQAVAQRTTYSHSVVTSQRLLHWPQPRLLSSF